MWLVVREVLGRGELYRGVALEAQRDKDIMVTGVGRASYPKVRVELVKQDSCRWKHQRERK